MNRETWLMAATRQLGKRFKSLGLGEVPADVKVSCGFPGGGSPRKRIGECWSRAASKAKVNEIFINPTQADKVQVFAILAHELCHAIDDCQSGHGAPFARLARGIGLEGKMTATHAGEDFTAWVNSLKLGDFPHEALLPRSQTRSDRSGARIKVTCQTTGLNYLVSKAGFQLLVACPFCEDDCHAK